MGFYILTTSLDFRSVPAGFIPFMVGRVTNLCCSVNAQKTHTCRQQFWVRSLYQAYWMRRLGFAFHSLRGMNTVPILNFPPQRAWCFIFTPTTYYPILPLSTLPISSLGWSARDKTKLSWRHAHKAAPAAGRMGDMAGGRFYMLAAASDVVAGVILYYRYRQLQFAH